MFQIFHKKRTAAHKLRSATPGHILTLERQELPGSGAQQYSWETYGLPVYPVFGRGNIPVTNPLRETFPGSYALQAVGIVGVPPTGILQGQFTTQPLMNPNDATAFGVVQSGQIPAGAYNIIPPSNPTLAP
jgi:hypothetical protein